VLPAIYVADLGYDKSKSKKSYFSYPDLLKRVSSLFKTSLPQDLPYFDIGAIIYTMLSKTA
jgi:hypothetical protein